MYVDGNFNNILRTVEAQIGKKLRTVSLNYFLDVLIKKKSVQVQVQVEKIICCKQNA